MPQGNFFHSFGRPVLIPGTLLEAAGQLVPSDREYADYVVQIGSLVPPTDDPLLPADIDVLAHMLVRIASRPSTIKPVLVGIIRSVNPETIISVQWERDPQRQQGYSKRWRDRLRFLKFGCSVPIEFSRAVRLFRAYARLMRIKVQSLWGDDYLIIPRGFAPTAPRLALH